MFASNKKAAFSNLRLWQSTAMAAAFAYSKFVCVRIKLYIMIGILTAGMVGYLTIDFYERRRKAGEKKAKRPPANKPLTGSMGKIASSSADIRCQDWTYIPVTARQGGRS